jgi:hypothetical protein
MQRLKALIWKAIFLLFMALSLNAQAKALAVPEAVVSFANREIAVLRASVQGRHRRFGFGGLKSACAYLRKRILPSRCNAVRLR